MRTLAFLLIKEFKQIFRNKALLPVIFVMPIIQLLILPLVADYEIDNIHIAIVDQDQSSFSRKLINDITASGYFIRTENTPNYRLALEAVEGDKADLLLEIPAHFEKELYRESRQSLFILINAINGVKANLGGSYLAKIISRYDQKVHMKVLGTDRIRKPIDITFSNWFNPYLNYKIFMVPAILVLMVTMISVYLCSLNIVKEKELGTIEQINVSPIKKHIYILGKLIPFWIIGVFIFTVGFFVIGRLVYGIVPVGNLLLMYAYLALFLVAMLGLGLLISTFAQTQQQAMSIAFFFMMIFVLMSGLFTPVDSMPTWAQNIAYCNPVTYFIEVMRMIVLKGSRFVHLTSHFGVMALFAILFNSLAVYNYKKTT